MSMKGQLECANGRMECSTCLVSSISSGGRLGKGVSVDVAVLEASSIGADPSWLSRVGDLVGLKDVFLVPGLLQDAFGLNVFRDHLAAVLKLFVGVKER